MNDLLNAMSSDMGINRFHGESEASFIYRICYSALGQWCLRTAHNSSAGVVGTTKHNQAIVLRNLMTRYLEIFPSVVDKFFVANNQQENFFVHIRRVYEETGYLLTDENKRNCIVNFGRCIPIGNLALFFGVPKTAYDVNGLGVFTTPTTYKISAKEFLLRDDLSCEEYFCSRFDPIDFHSRDIEIGELEFFNPLSSHVPSRAWGKSLESDCTVARKSEWGPFYRVMRTGAMSLQFVDEPIESQGDVLISYEYRRIYFALKAHYKMPLKAMIKKLDDGYSKLSLRGQLPNREYYYLLLLSWPFHNAFDKVNFLIRNEFLREAIAVITNIGIKVEGGPVNG